MPRDFQARLCIGSDFDDATFAVLGRGYIKVAVHVECQSLRASEAAEVVAHRSVTVDPVDTIEARGGWPGDEQIAGRPERQMIGGDARFQRRKDKRLSIR